MNWFRFYGEVINDPKVQKLTPTMFKHWVNVLCLASMHDGVIPLPCDVAFATRISEGRAAEMLDELLALNLLDADDEGTLTPHNWSARQYKSDTSTERVKKHRRNVSVTPPETEADTEQKDIRSVAKATRPNLDFENFKKCFPRRRGSNPWKPALLLFEKAVRAGTPAEMISRAAAAYGAECQRNGIVDTEKIAQAQTWLRQERYSDYVQANGADVVPIFDVRRHMI